MTTNGQFLNRVSGWMNAWTNTWTGRGSYDFIFVYSFIHWYRYSIQTNKTATEKLTVYQFQLIVYDVPFHLIVHNFRDLIFKNRRDDEKK